MSQSPDVYTRHMVWWSQERVTTPPSGHTQSYPGRWWVVNDHGEVLLYAPPWAKGQVFPQCNLNRYIVERRVEQYASLGALGVVRLEHAFLPDDPGWY